MELLLKNVEEKHLGLIAELAKTLKISIEGLTDHKIKPALIAPLDNEKHIIDEGLFLSWINK